jgi:hypothetical protein
VNAVGLQYQPNTNLEQISDWLTKILVGVGLTQIDKIRQVTLQASAHIGQALGGTGTGEQFALVIMLYFLTCGFLFGYLWTRVFFAVTLIKADVATYISQMEIKLVGQQEQQAQNDAAALSTMNRYLNAETGAPEVSPEDLKKAMKRASPSVKVQIFYQAQAVRRQNWQNPGDNR